MAAGPHYPQLLQHIDKLTGNTVGATTLANSPWIMLVNVPLQPVFAGQPDHVEVIWSYGLWTTATESLVPQTNPGLHRRKVRPRVTPSRRRRGRGRGDRPPHPDSLHHQPVHVRHTHSSRHRDAR
ncbi:oleate hydratase [Catenuloplanes sp. NPDC020197]|uniref:oleate hydratase n=1 Tax=Catenuloplanes TaxID=33874 RepID=UPI0035B50FB3